jgi:hypothetical protein
MKSDLDLLIEYYEGEKLALESSIKNYLLEHDYLYAHYQQEGLWHLTNQLDTLKQFKDPLYYKKEGIERQIEWMTRLETQNNYSSFKDYISEYKNQLEQLNKYPVHEYFNDTQVIDDALHNLYKRKEKGFKLYLSKDDCFYLDFEMVDHFLKITHKQESKFDDSEYLRIIDDDDDKDHRYPLEKLGFNWDPVDNKFIYLYDMRLFKEALPVKILLSRIAYEIFRLRSEKR